MALFRGPDRERTPVAEATPPKPDYARLWGNYKTWVEEAQSRFNVDDERAKLAASGVDTSSDSFTGRLQEVQEQFESQMAELRGTTTFQTLQEGVPQGKSVEEFYGAQYGSITPAQQVSKPKGPKAPKSGGPAFATGEEQPYNVWMA